MIAGDDRKFGVGMFADGLSQMRGEHEVQCIASGGADFDQANVRGVLVDLSDQGELEPLLFFADEQRDVRRFALYQGEIDRRHVFKVDEHEVRKDRGHSESSIDAPGVRRAGEE